MKISAFKCPLTGTLFETQEQLDEHKASLEYEELYLKAQADREAKLIELINKPRLEATGLAHLGELLRECYHEIMKLHEMGPASGKLDEISISAEVSSFMQNALVKPLPNSLDDVKVPSQRQLRGKVFFLWAKRPYIYPAAFDTYFKYIHLGTGGSGGRREGGGVTNYYDLELCIDDFPKIHSSYVRYDELESDYRQYKKEIVSSTAQRCAADVELTAYKDELTALVEQQRVLTEKINAREAAHEAVALSVIPDKNQAERGNLRLMFEKQYGARHHT